MPLFSATEQNRSANSPHLRPSEEKQAEGGSDGREVKRWLGVAKDSSAAAVTGTAVPAGLHGSARPVYAAAACG